MQHRMKTHQLAAEQIDSLLKDGLVGSLATINETGKPCDTNTKYQSVIAQGTAEIVCDIDRKRIIIGAIVDKYTPQYSGKQLPDNMVKGTVVVAITITEMTGKYWE